MRIPQTTTHLKLPRVRFDLPPHVAGAICTFALIAIAALAGRIATTPAPEMPKPIIVYATAPASIYPTAVPVQPTPDQQVYAELDQLRQRLAELEAQQEAAPDPQVIYQTVYGPAPAPAPAATCQSAGVPGKMVEVCGDGDLSEAAKQKWIATYGGSTP